jgi:hypothetical protein
MATTYLTPYSTICPKIEELYYEHSLGTSCPRRPAYVSIGLLDEESLQLEMEEYNTAKLRTFGYSMSFIQFLAKAEA